MLVLKSHLVKGIYDYFNEATGEGWRGLVIGPSASGAQLEGSKAFSKKFMQRHNIPTAAYAEFTQQILKKGKNILLNIHYRLF